MKISLLLSLLLTSLLVNAAEDAELNFIYTLDVETDSNWTSIEIRDDAIFVIPPDNKPLSISSKKGGREMTLSQKSIKFTPITRGEATFQLYILSKNKVLGLTICKGSRTSYTSVKTAEGKHKHDIDEQDVCEKAALVLELH